MTTVLESLNSGLHRAFQSNDSVVLLGEDVLDPYGGAFRVTQGLSTAYPQRVLTTPISEAGITGIAAGMALRGLRPVVEIMFGDFVTLIADQLINHIAKFRWMYNDQVRLPLVIRTPMGGRRGYGPTHSQSLEKLFLGVPGLRVLAPCALGDPGNLLAQAILETEDPVLFVENKLLYLLPVQGEQDLEEFSLSQVCPGWGYHLRLREAPPPAVTLAAYGYMAELARQAALQLAYEHEIFIEVLVPTRLAPFDLGPITAAASQSRRLLAVEEGTQALGWGAEVLAQAAQTLGPRLLKASRVTSRAVPVPASGPLETEALPGVEHIVGQVRALVNGE